MSDHTTMKIVNTKRRKTDISYQPAIKRPSKASSNSSVLAFSYKDEQGSSTNQASNQRVTLEPFHHLILVQSFRQYPVFYDRTDTHYRCMQNGTCKKKKREAEEIVSSIKRKEQEAVQNGCVKEHQLHYLITKYSAAPFTELRRRFNQTCKSVHEQLQKVEETGNQDFFTFGFYGTWKKNYDAWFKKGVSGNNFGFGKLLGEAFDQHCPDKTVSNTTPKSHRKSVVRLAKPVEVSPGPQLTGKTPKDTRNEPRVKKFVLPTPESKTSMPKHPVPCYLDAAEVHVAASLRRRTTSIDETALIRLFGLLMRFLEDYKYS